MSQLSKSEAKKVVDAGHGYSHRLKNEIYSERSDKQLLANLTNWSPVVRDRAAKAIAKRMGDYLQGQLAQLAVVAQSHWLFMLLSNKKQCS